MALNLNYAGPHRKRPPRRRRPQATTGTWCVALACGLLSAVSSSLLVGVLANVPRGISGMVHPYHVVLMMPLFLVGVTSIGTIAGVMFLRGSVLWPEWRRWLVKLALAGCTIGWLTIASIALLLLHGLATQP